MERSDGGVHRAGAEVLAMTLENAGVVCGRVDSIAVIGNRYNFLELGAAKVALRIFSCPNPPFGSWYRFWVRLWNSSISCGKYLNLGAGGTDHPAIIYRDFADYHFWHFRWDGVDFTTLRINTMTSGGTPVANWERNNGADSGYAVWNGMEYVDVNGNPHPWDTVCFYSREDLTYGLDVITASYFKVDVTPNGGHC